MTSPARPNENVYRPVGRAIDFLTAKDSEVLFEGPAGTGKSFAAWNKLHIVCESVPGVRILVVRKTRSALTHSGLVTFEEKVVPQGHPVLKGAARLNRSVYRYPNGAEIVLGGMDNAAKVLSTEFDIIYCQEATELTENDWETLSTRLRNGRLAYQQIIADCNPDRPTHWLNQRCHAGKTRRIISRHEDNPALYRDGAWTDEGRRYISVLDQLTGARLQRLRYGRWAGSEGTVYENWNPDIHLVDEVPKDIRRRIWIVDFGYVNPFVWGELVEHGDDQLCLISERYLPGIITEDHARAIVAMGLPKPEAIVCDHDSEDRATFERHVRLGTVAAKKDVLTGIAAVEKRLRVRADGKPGLTIYRGALTHGPSDALREAKKPTCTVEEFDGYVWEPEKEGRAPKESPVKMDDHGMDMLRYGVMHFDQRIRKGLA